MSQFFLTHPLRHSLLLSCLYLFFAFQSQASTSAEEQNAISQDIQAKQRIESERREVIRRRESEEIKNIGKQKSLDASPQPIDKDADDQICRKINEFQILENSQIYSFTLNRKFIKPLQKSKPNSCFTQSDLAKLHEQISSYYLQRGYVLARVYFDVSAAAEGIIKIVIEEGKLEKLEIHDNSKLNEVLPFRRITQKFFAFPSLSNNSDHVVNLRDIEQGIEQINRLSSQSAKMTMDAGSKAGYSNINVENTIGHQATISVGADNSGNQSTGRQKKKASFNYDNFFGINDNIYLNYSESTGMPLFGSSSGFNNEIGTDDNTNNRFSKAFYASTSIPFGYYTFGASYSYSNYLLTTSGNATTVKSSGNSESKTYYIDRVLSRGQKYKISLKGELGQSDTDSYLEDTYLPVNSRQTTEANFYLNNTIYLANGSLYFQPKYSKGLTAFGALKDDRNLAADKARAQFETFGLYAQSNINFNLPKTAIPLNHKLTFDSTKSSNSLYGSDQFSLGGRYTVRGFQESIISGDSGYLIKNDLSVRFVDILPKSLLATKAMNYGGEKFSPSAAFSKMRLGIFHDYGYVRNHVIDSQNDEGYMSGAGATLSYSGDIINWDLTYSKGLHSPQFLRNLDNLTKDNETIYFSLSFNLGLL
jgi:hemolysin activation/secretion protein